MNATKPSVGIVPALERIDSQKWSFLGAFLLVFFLTMRVLVAADFVPNPIPFGFPKLPGATFPQLKLETSPLVASADSADSVTTTGPSSSGAHSDGVQSGGSNSLNMNGELPIKVVAPSIGLSATVANPATTNIDTLDHYLLSGAVRYPTSATLGQNGNVVLFGHSSYLPVVFNHAYKTFDGIQKLKAGDPVTVYSGTNAYTYAVTSVEMENVGSSAGIPLATNGPTLTLATCDSFGKKTDRFVVTATLVGSSARGS